MKTKQGKVKPKYLLKLKQLIKHSHNVAKTYEEVVKVTYLL